MYYLALVMLGSCRSLHRVGSCATAFAPAVSNLFLQRSNTNPKSQIGLCMLIMHCIIDWDGTRSITRPLVAFNIYHMGVYRALQGTLVPNFALAACVFGILEGMGGFRSPNPNIWESSCWWEKGKAVFISRGLGTEALEIPAPHHKVGSSPCYTIV